MFKFEKELKESENFIQMNTSDCVTNPNKLDKLHILETIKYFKGD